MSSRSEAGTVPFQAAWWGVLCLVSLDYLSTLAYQPALAFETAGRLAPLGNLVVAGATLFGALPVYLWIAGRSPHGGGAVALLENLIPGWRGKLLIVVLLGFTATDFVFTRTFSAAAAAEHLLRNPDPAWQDMLQRIADQCAAWAGMSHFPIVQSLAKFSSKQLAATLILLAASSLFGFVMLHGFTRPVLRLCIVVALAYFLANAVVIGSGLIYLGQRPEIFADWWAHIQAGDWGLGPARGPVGPGLILSTAFAVFPKLALGLSGFELTMIVMPLVRGQPGDHPRLPRGRIIGTRKMLIAATLFGTSALVLSSLIASTLIPPSALINDGPATHRALSYLAHGESLIDGLPGGSLNPFFGASFGTFYDALTIVTLSLAGASVAIGLRDFVPPYLHRLGMEFNWSIALGTLLWLFSIVKLVVTVGFQADLDLQRTAYSTAVLAVLTASAFASALDRRKLPTVGPFHRHRFPWFFWAIAIGFFLATLWTIWLQPGGLRIALAFIIAILFTSMVSRSFRAVELRFNGFEYVNDESRFLWESLRAMDFPVLVPHRPGDRPLHEKEAMIRKHHRLGSEIPIVFLEVTLGDASGFYHKPLLEVLDQQDRFVVRLDRCTSIAHVIAEVALELSRESRPPELHFGWSNESPLTANFHFLLFGHGNVPWMVNYLLQIAEKNEDKRPRVIIG